MAAAQTGIYGKWVVEAPRPPLQEKVKLRLFCVPPVGMGGACFHPWAKALPEGVELMPLELPGRGFRMGEDLCTSSLPSLAKDVLDGIGRELLAAKPFAFFGHSFGSWLAYEVVQELIRRSWPMPLKLYCSANRAPQLAGMRHDPDRLQPSLGKLEKYTFWESFDRRYGKNPDLRESYIQDMVLPILQADFSLLESYEPSGLEPLPMPLCACCAKGDSRCRPAQLTAWSEVAGAEGFQERWFENVMKPESWATEHRYIIDNPSSLLLFLRKDLPLVAQFHVEGYSGIDGPLPEEAALEETPAGGNDGSERAGSRCTLS